MWHRVPAVRATPHGREMTPLVWPLVPFWAKGDLPKYSTANCRSESGVPFSKTAATKAAFRGAWQRNRGCLVLFSYFFKWGQRVQPKQPWRIYPADAPLFAMAGIWDRSPETEVEAVESCTIVTTEPNSLLREIGHHRASVLLSPDDWDTWLTGDSDQAESLIAPPPAEIMRAHPVTRRVNNPGYQGEDLLAVADSREDKLAPPALF